MATGYRAGGPNVLPPGAPPGTPPTYDSDGLTSYEIGLKAGTPDGRFSIDMAAYYLDWEDIQLFAIINDVGINANGGKIMTAKAIGIPPRPAHNVPQPYLLFLGDMSEAAYAKTPVADPMRGGVAFDRLVDTCLG